ncbi:hypothetical protein AC578_4492 [Pseudocercospora eumusae]|uniref:Uncharacterized protein n=1 Tax=Pseudocercospora eumusae TaxID=321146 RepID=A0A139HBQ5_9PEZI|nr:hypothetical protein AC578_4492 [Pseudocercospora eumusae]
MMINFSRGITNQALRSLDGCVELQAGDLQSPEWLSSDLAFLHSILATSYANQDFEHMASSVQPSQNTTFYLQKTFVDVASENH